MKIYIDSEFKCHTTNPDGSFREVENAFFDGKCHEFIEGYRYDPDNGRCAPWKSLSELDNAQREYEKKLLSEYEAALAEIEAALGV